MNMTNTNKKLPNITDFLIVLTLLGLMIVSKKCAAQTIPTDTTVLKYLYKEAASAYYMRKDIILLDSTISLQKHIIELKDSLIANRNDALHVSEFETELNEGLLNTCEKNNATLQKKVKFFKFTTISAAILGGISTIYFWIK